MRTLFKLNISADIFYKNSLNNLQKNFFFNTFKVVKKNDLFFLILKRQPERLFHNILCLKRPLVGPLVFSLSLILIFVGRGRGQLKIHPAHFIVMTANLI